MKKILIIEDDISLAEELKTLLDSNGYCSFVIESFENTKETILNSFYDLLLLDINIPNVNGQFLLKEIRKDSNIPVIMVTSKDSEMDEMLCMSYGADDYITKPYNPNILLLRIGALFRRMDNEVEFLKYDDLKVNIKKGLISSETEEIMLTKNEMLIFHCLLMKRGQIVTREEIMTTLWDNSEYVNDNALTVNISRLRSKLSSIGYIDRIETRKGQGYILL